MRFLSIFAVLKRALASACGQSRRGAALLLTALSLHAVAGAAATQGTDVGAHKPDSKMAVAVLAGGCFWGTQAVFQHLKGVSEVISGYAGGSPETADYTQVSTGTTRHAESIRVTYDPARISYEQLLRVFFSVAHDPTQLNRQGPDRGPQYRSVVFYTDAAQQQRANAYIAQLQAKKTFSAPIVTTVVPLNGFYPAEAYHQDFLRKHPDHPYIVMHDLPKLAALRQQFPELYVEPR